MNDEDLVVDGAQLHFVRSGDGSWDVLAVATRVHDSPIPIGAIELASDGAGFVARRLSGDALTRLSPWGGPVTAQFGSRALAVRALLDAGETDE